MIKIPLGKLPFQNYKQTVPQSKLPNVPTFRVTKLCKEIRTLQNIALFTSPPPDTTWWTFPGISPTGFITLEAKVCSSDETRNNNKGLNTAGKSRKLRATPSQEPGRGSALDPGREEEGTGAQPMRKGVNQSKTTVLLPKRLEKMLWSIEIYKHSQLKYWNCINCCVFHTKETD